MPSTCVFEFDRPEPIYFSGEIVKARIKLNTTSRKDVRNVYLVFNGEAKVKWEESKSRTVNGKTQHYTEYYRASQVYINQRTSVFNGSVLPAGLHTYTIEIPIPTACPTSCSEAYGHIRYELTLTIDRPYKFDNEFTQPLTIIKQLNLNLSPEYALPLSAEEVKYFCCFCCSSGPVVATVTIPFGGYAPGQKIKYKLELNNQSHKYDLDGFELKLKQEYKFIAHTPHHKTKYCSNTLVKSEQEMNCLRLTKRVINGELAIPSVPPSTNDCGIISVSYNIKMTIDCGVCHSDSEILIPITIGTVPLLQSASNPSNVNMIQRVEIPTAPNMTPDDMNSDKPPSYELYKPPSFEESTDIGENFIDKDVNEHRRVNDFIPKYPMYTNFAVPTAPADQGDSLRQPLLMPELNTEQSSASRPTGQVPSSSSSGLPYPTNFNGSNNMPTAPTSSTSGYGWKN